MTKEDIYTKLEYNGKYDTKIKTNLRNMIKDNKDNKEQYNLLLEVQNELETGKAKIIYSRMQKKDNSENIESLKKEKTLEDNKDSVIKEEKVEKKESKKNKNNKEEKKSKKKSTKNKKPKKKKKTTGNIIAKIFIILFALLMIASSVSTIFSYFR